MIELALLVGAGTLAAGVVAALGLRALPTVRLQVAALACLSVALPLAAVILSGWAMFHMGDDVKILAVASAAATAATGAGLLIARSIANRLDRVREAAGALAQGDLGSRVPEGGPAELNELAASFNQMAEALERLFDARRELVAWASHDLRTPLASMQAMVEALEDGLGEPERYLPALREQVRTLSTLVDDLFELSRIDSEALVLDLRDTRLDELVASCVRALEPEADARRIRLSTRIGAPATARCAPEKVERVLFNLLTNALRHTPSDGAVAVSLDAANGTVRIAVEDTGDGLTPDAAQRMFERFWRGDRARSGGGAGLGLAIARGLVEAQGGRIWAESRAGGGARVCFTLPGV
ncbi:MAG TPA: HAMP domain-containing sensor histidine kinase [Gaiellaceae bacterium]|nr:HAMP domain-containing sensor histidine kinase [Gaiellaceae bacterium]